MNPQALGLFQLEGLSIARPSFTFLDIRLHPQVVSTVRVQSVLSHATPVRALDVPNHLQNLSTRVDEPIILLCEDGRLSSGIAADLESAGFTQVYIVDGGLDGLLREATASG